MATLAQARCYHHATREAVARCPVCSYTYCRECITDHGGRVLCASCLATRGADKQEKSLSGWRWLGLMGLAGFGLLMAWWLFYLLAALLLRIPAEFHEGSFWE